MIAAAVLAATVARFVVMHVDVNAYGVPGTGTIIVDRSNGHFVRRFDAGAASEQEGWDGTHAWRADATGIPRVQGNRGERREILAWSSVLVGSVDSPPHHARVVGATDHVDIAFDAYHHFGDLSLPARIVARSEENGVWTTELRGAEFPARVPLVAFAPPQPPPSDASLNHLTSVAVSMTMGSPVLEVRVNGKQLRFLFDTGGQNVITTRAAALVGLHAVGGGTVSGGGGGTAPIRYAVADSVRVGAAEMRRQPFIVLPEESLPPIDGIVGYELLSRFAARLDMARMRLELAPSARAFGKAVAPAQFDFFDRQPEVDGALDKLRGPFSIDTGSSLTVQVQTPIVRSQNLVVGLHATVATYANDVGGRYPIYLVRAHQLRLGSGIFSRPLVDLLNRSNSSGNATIIGNVGDGILRRWVLVFDYAHQTIDFRPGGDTTGNVVRDRSGIILVVKSNGLVARQVLSGTPAAQAGLTEGMKIVAVDGSVVDGSDLVRVRRLLQGAPGTRVRLQLVDGSTRQLTLRQYL